MSEKIDEGSSDPSRIRVPRTRTIVVDPGQAPERIDTFLTRVTMRATRNKVQTAIEQGSVLVNGRPTKVSYKVRPGDRIEVTLMKPPPIVLVAQDIPLDIIYEDADLLIVDKPAGMVTHPGYGNRDRTLVNAVLFHTGTLPIPDIVEESRSRGVESRGGEEPRNRESKGEGRGAKGEEPRNRGTEEPIGRVEEPRNRGTAEPIGGVGEPRSRGTDEPRGGEQGGALAEELAELLDAVSESSEPSDEGAIDDDLAFDEEQTPEYAEIRPGIVHRLDKETSGLMVVAKNAEALAFLARQFADRTAKREYWAVVAGRIDADEGEIEGNIARDPRDRKRFVVSQREGKYALTRYRVVERYDGATLIALRLATGRTHQIRVHCAHIGHPVFGDPVYGGRSAASGGSGGKQRQHMANLLKLIDRQALHARLLGIMQPSTRQWLEFESEPPEDMRRLIRELRGGTSF